jgi:hypothetical protein
MPVPGREEGVRRELRIDLGELQLAGDRQGEGVDLGAADHVHPSRIAGQRQRLLQRRRRLRTLGPERRIAADDDVAAAGQRPADRLPCLSSHDDRPAERHPLEARQVVRNVHEEPAAMADAAVAGDGGNEADEGTGHAGDCRRARPR